MVEQTLLPEVRTEIKEINRQMRQEDEQRVFWRRIHEEMGEARSWPADEWFDDRDY